MPSSTYCLTWSGFSSIASLINSNNLESSLIWEILDSLIISSGSFFFSIAWYKIFLALSNEIFLAYTKSITPLNILGVIKNWSIEISNFFRELSTAVVTKLTVSKTSLPYSKTSSK